MNRREMCYKLYLPVNGGATVVIDEVERELVPGNLYFISGFHLDSQYCKDSMEVFWVHFIPDSLRLKYLLSKSVPFYSWPIENLLWAKPFYDQLRARYDFQPSSEVIKIREVPDDILCRLHGLLGYLMADLIQDKTELSQAASPALIKLEKAIEFMDRNFLFSPTLEEIAREADLAPNYFHRLFKKTFETTPYNYLINRRMDFARQLLNSTIMTVKEIAFRSGYDNEFHFSRVFKNRFGVSPSAYRKLNVQA